MEIQTKYPFRDHLYIFLVQHEISNSEQQAKYSLDFARLHPVVILLWCEFLFCDIFE